MTILFQLIINKYSYMFPLKNLKKIFRNLNKSLETDNNNEVIIDYLKYLIYTSSTANKPNKSCLPHAAVKKRGIAGHIKYKK